MKTIIATVIIAGAALSAFAVDRADLDQRITTITAKFDALEQQPDKRVPPEVLRRAQGLILLDRTKAGLIFAYQGGSGIALARNPKTGHWSPPAFLSANQASVGFQIGGEKSFFVIALMSTNTEHFLTEPNFNFSAAAQGTAGNQSSGNGVSFNQNDHPYLVYSDKTGLYGGAAIKAGAVAPDETANHIYYGEPLGMADILYYHKAKRSVAAEDLISRINAWSKPQNAQANR